jgi:hypothetical protein
MNSRGYDEWEWRKFVIWTERQDRYRQLALRDVYPEYWEVMRPFYEPYARDISEEALSGAKRHLRVLGG